MKLNYYGAANMENKNGCFDSGYLTSGEGNAVLTTNAVDVSNYSKICVIIDFTRNDARLTTFDFGLYRIRPNTWTETPYNKLTVVSLNALTQALSGTQFFYQVDISDIKESAYAMLLANCWFKNHSGTFNVHTKIYEAWLEK